jgi:hypothetical protein
MTNVGAVRLGSVATVVRNDLGVVAGGVSPVSVGAVHVADAVFLRSGRPALRRLPG